MGEARGTREVGREPGKRGREARGGRRQKRRGGTQTEEENRRLARGGAERGYRTNLGGFKTAREPARKGVQLKRGMGTLEEITEGKLTWQMWYQLIFYYGIIV
eukprot:2642894-Rhodomonas_salina.1